MSYLEMESAPLPDLTSAVISLWFRAGSGGPGDSFPDSWQPEHLDSILGTNETAYGGASYWPTGIAQIVSPIVFTYPFGAGTTFKDGVAPLICFGDPAIPYDRVEWQKRSIGAPIWQFGKGNVPQTLVAQYPVVVSADIGIVPPSYIGVRGGKLRIVLQTRNKARYTGCAWAQSNSETVTVMTPLVGDVRLHPALAPGVPSGWRDFGADYGQYRGYNFWYDDVSRLECAQHPEAFVMDVDVFVGDNKWHHLLLSFDLGGGDPLDPTPLQPGGGGDATDTGGGDGGGGGDDTGGGGGDDAPLSLGGMVNASATGPAGYPPHPGTYGQYSGSNGEYALNPISNDPRISGAPFEDCGVYGYADGGTITSACRAWVAVDGKNIKGKSLNHAGAWNELVQKGGQALLDTLDPNAILPPNAFLIPFAEIRSSMTTSKTAWEREYRTILGKFTGPACRISVTSEPRRLDYARPSYEFTPGPLPVGGQPIAIPAGKMFGEDKWNTHVYTAELQIWANKTIDTSVKSNIELFITDEGEAEVNFRKVEAVLGKPEIRLHGSGNWKKGRNTGSTGYTTDDNDKRSPNEAGQFDPVDKIIRHYPDPKIPVADPEGETALLTVADE